MAWTTPSTAVAGSTALTAAFWNEQVRDNFVELQPWTTAWTAWTPTWTNLTVGNATQVARYKQVGKTVLMVLHLTFGSTTSITGTDISFTIPVNQASDPQRNTAVANFQDTGTAVIPAFAEMSGSKIFVRGINVAGTYATWAQVTTTVPFTWTTSDVIYVNAFYEAA